MAAEQRGQWKSRFGFIMAAAGSAIGLGNIVLFGANAYKYGAGAFYLPYLIALFVVGIPVMILELGLGSYARRAFPAALNKLSGRLGEFFGWFTMISGTLLTMYYIALLAWVLGMLIGAFGPLWEPTTPTPGYAMDKLDNPTGYFFTLISTWKPLIFVILIWCANLFIISRGVQQIEIVNKIFLPMMWFFVFILIVRGITLPHGLEGLYLLFTPNFEVMKEPEVWKGAFSQIFFTLSLGFGIMTAYASYLPKDADQVSNPLIISFMNCGFEFLAGIAIFSTLFSFSIAPKASGLTMSFFVIPAGIKQMPGGEMAVIAFGVMFFLLLLMAGITSSVSLVEGLMSALIDKFEYSRRQLVFLFGIVGCLGSTAFALPQIVDPELAAAGTLGLTLLDIFDHWAFGYGLLMGGLFECLLLGWFFDLNKLIDNINQYAKIPLPKMPFKILVQFIIPGIIIFVLGSSVADEFTGGLYGLDHVIDGFQPWLPWLCLGIWLLGSSLLAFILTKVKDYHHPHEMEEMA